MRHFLIATVLVFSAKFASAQSTVQSAAPVTAEELSAYLQQNNQAVAGDPSLTADLRNVSTPAYYGWYWRCNAWPVGFNPAGLYAYWISPNLYVARYNALNLCVNSYGTYCWYSCGQYWWY